ncbi:SIMPL domain-containing protein [Pelistega sp. MC2]|uniref:SIMPL domain-containing protein n=1 Tax=Pelistega sp. MC2 TaxID=1720297 RepID=UPI0008D94F6A|nr:SIMPL domain-containing protein [Pelistega sp. MC2]
MKTIIKVLALSTIAMVAWQSGVLAQTEMTTNKPANDQTVINLSASVQEEVKPDVVRLTLSKQLQGTNQQELTTQLNKAINAVLEKGKADPDLTIRNGDYGFWSVGDKEKEISWVMRGEVIVTSKDFAKAQAFIAMNKDMMTLDNIQFILSEESRNKVEEKLIANVAEAFNKKASAVAKAFGSQTYHINSIQLNNNAGRQPRMYAAAAATTYSSKSADDAVNLEGGKVEVNVTADGQISLR